MNTVKKILILLLAFTLVFALASCVDGGGGGGDTDCTEHADANNDGKCDKCNVDVEPAQRPSGDGDGLVLIEGGKPKFNFVVEDDVSAAVMNAVNKVKKDLKKLDIEVEILYDDGKNITDCEVLIGNITTRGEKYSFDPHTLGPKGTAVKRVDSKIILLGGSEAYTVAVIEEFAEDFLGIKSGVKELDSVTVLDKALFDKPMEKDDYRVTSVKFGAVDAAGLKIYADTSNIEALKTAQYLQDLFYTSGGYWLDIVRLTESTDATSGILIKVIPNTREGNGFSISFKDSLVTIETEFANKLLESVEKGFAKFLIAKGEIVLDKNSVSFTTDVRHIYYSDFVENIDTSGSSNVYEQLKAVHDYANTYGHVVCARPGEKYLITETGGIPIEIKTDCIWDGATFIFDDRHLEAQGASASNSVFKLVRDYKPVAYDVNSQFDIVRRINEAGGIKKDEINASLKFFDLALGYPAMVVPENSEHKVYIRYGGNANNGSEQAELIVIDEEGNIDPLTPFLLDYAQVTKLTIYRIDDTPIKLEGGTFITRANNAECSYDNGFTRNIMIVRSNVTIEGITHKITDEGDRGSSYSGFFTTQNCNNIQIRDCVVQAHRAYVDEKRVDEDGNVLEYGTTMGTYELGGYMTNGYYCYNVTQSNFYDPQGKPTDRWYDENGEGAKNNANGAAGIWGVMGTNYCKNITYESCVLNRMDAHAGVINATVLDTEIIHINLIGGGKMLIKDSTVYNSHVVKLREDYGSTWNGEVHIINTTHVVSGSSTPVILSGAWYNHYFGYTTYVPSTVILDGYKLESAQTTVRIYGIGISTDVTGPTYAGEKNENPPVFPEKVIFRNKQNGITFTTDAVGFFESIVEMVEE